jgi:homoserine dehydrogenase
MDVARKVVILGRVAGLNVSLDSLVVENVVPTELQVPPPSISFPTAGKTRMSANRNYAAL